MKKLIISILCVLGLLNISYSNNTPFKGESIFNTITVVDSPQYPNPAPPPEHITGPCPFNYVFTTANGPFGEECLVDWDCIHACNLQYQACLDAGLLTACNSWAIIRDAYNDCVDTAYSKYMTTYNLHKAAFDECVADADNEFYNCMQLCPPNNPIDCVNARNSAYWSCLSNIEGEPEEDIQNYNDDLFVCVSAYWTAFIPISDAWRAARAACKAAYEECIDHCIDCP